MAQVLREHGVVLTELHITRADAVTAGPSAPAPDLRDLTEAIEDVVDDSCADFRFPRPRIVLEPGHAVVARSGVALVRVIGVARVSDSPIVVSVDAATRTNLGVLLRSDKSTVVLANRHSHAAPEHMMVTTADRVREEEIAARVPLPHDLRAGDLLAVAATGRCDVMGRPPVIAVCNGNSRALGRLCPTDGVPGLSA